MVLTNLHVTVPVSAVKMTSVIAPMVENVGSSSSIFSTSQGSVFVPTVVVDSSNSRHTTGCSAGSFAIPALARVREALRAALRAASRDIWARLA